MFVKENPDKKKLISVEEFVKIKPWLLLTLSMFLHNQLRFNYEVL